MVSMSPIKQISWRKGGEHVAHKTDLEKESEHVSHKTEAGERVVSTSPTKQISWRKGGEHVSHNTVQLAKGW